MHNWFEKRIRGDIAFFDLNQNGDFMATRLPVSTGLTLSFSADGSQRIAVESGSTVAFGFDSNTATVDRADNDLVIRSESGDTITLADFFVVGERELPTFVLPDSTRIRSADCLSALDVNITTTAGPAATPPSDGEGEYLDGAGSLLSGVDRTVIADEAPLQWTRMSPDAPGVETTENLVAAAGAAGTPDSPSEPLSFNARAVLHMQNEGEAPGAEPYDGSDTILSDGNVRAETYTSISSMDGTGRPKSTKHDTADAVNHPHIRDDVDACDTGALEIRGWDDSDNVFIEDDVSSVVSAGVNFRLGSGDDAVGINGNDDNSVIIDGDFRGAMTLGSGSDRVELGSMLGGSVNLGGAGMTA